MTTIFSGLFVKLINAPVPIVVALILPQVVGKPDSAPLIPGGPQWAGIVVATVAVLLWFLNAVGRLPGTNGGTNRRGASFTEDDRIQLRKVADLLATRNDDGMERILVMGQQTREIHEVMARLAVAQEQTANHMKVLAENSIRNA